jgi:integrase
MPDTTKKPSIKSVTINAEWLRQLRKRLAAGECEEFNAMRSWAREQGRGDGFFYVYKEAALTSQLKVRISKASIALVANRNNRYITLLSCHIQSDETIKIADVKAALLAGSQPEGPPQSKRERAKEENERKYAKRTYRDWYKEYCELVELHGDIRRFKDRQNYIENRFLDATLPAALLGPHKKTYGDLAPGELDAETAQDWQDSILRQRGKHPARLAKTYLKSMFTYLIEKRPAYRGIQGFPDTGVIKFEEGELETVNPLSDSQIAKIWRACDKLNPIQSGLVRFLMLSARRRGETQKLLWTDIDFEARKITFRAETTKAKRAYVMPLSPRVEDILRKLPRITQFVFPAPRNGDIQNSRLLNHIDHIITGRPYLRSDFDAAGIKYLMPPRKRQNKLFEWKFHDFRDTALNILEERIGEDYAVYDGDLVLGHDVSDGKRQRKAYSSLIFLPRKKILFERLENYILSLVEEQFQQSVRVPKLVKQAEELSAGELEAMLANLHKMKHERAKQS